MGIEGIVYRTGLQKRFVKTIIDKLNNKFHVLRSRVTDFEKEAKENGYAETPWGRKMYKKAKSGYWALLAQATAGDYFKYILVQIAEKLPDLILSAPLFDGCLYKIKNDQQKIEKIMEVLIEISTKQIEGFCRMAVDFGSGESWHRAVQSATATDSQ